MVESKQQSKYAHARQPAMQKTENVLLSLTSEEKNETLKFVQRRLKTLNADHLPHIQQLVQMSKQYMRRLQMDKMQYVNSTNRPSQLMAKLHDAALVDFQNIIKNLEQTVYQINAKIQKKQQGDTTEIEQKIENLIVQCDEEEIKHARMFMNDKVSKLRLPELKIFRDSCQDLLTWWESERGQTEGLHLDQVGNVNSATGRLAIRQKRETFQKAVLNPFKGFFRDLNTLYQRMAKESTVRAQQRAAQLKNNEAE